MKTVTRAGWLALSLTVIFPGCDHKQKGDVSPDTATFDANGTAHIARVVPMPTTVSAEAQKWLASLTQKKQVPQTLEQRRVGTDEWRKRASAEARKLYPVNIEETTTAGVRTDIITPMDTPGSQSRPRVDQFAWWRIQLGFRFVD